MDKLRKVMDGLECCGGAQVYLGHCPGDCPYLPNSERADQCVCALHKEALDMLDKMDQIISALLDVGYPHNFQREEPWIVNYMYAITGVIRKAVHLRNGEV